MVDILNKEIYVGDKVAYLPTREYMRYAMQIGIVTKIAKSNNSCWCKSVISDYSNELLRHPKEILKL